MNYYTISYYVFFGILFAGALWCMYKIASTDWHRRIIPDAFLFPLMIAGLIVTTFFPWTHGIHAAVVGGAFGYALSAFVGFAFDHFIRKKNKDAVPPIGMGDIKLIFTGGIWLGATGLAWALAAACAGALIWSKRTRERYVPFAPFFIGGGILSFIANAFLL